MRGNYLFTEVFTTVDVERLSGDHAAPGRREEHHRVGDVVLRRDLAQRISASRSLTITLTSTLRSCAIQPRYISTDGPPIQPGVDRVDADVVGPELVRQPLHRGTQRALRRRVVDLVGADLALTHREDEHDRRVAVRGRGLFQRRHACLGELERPPHVHVVDLAPLGQIGRFEAAELAGTKGVVHQHVEPPEVVEAALRQRVALDAIGDVRRHRDRVATLRHDLVGGLGEIVGRARASTTVAPLRASAFAFA